MARLSITQGDTAVLRIAITDPDCGATDLTGYAIMFTLKRSKGDSDFAAVWQGTLAAGDIVIVDADPALGEIDVTIPHSATVTMRPNKPYYWDIQLSQNGLIFTPCAGTMFVDGEVTRTAPES